MPQYINSKGESIDTSELEAVHLQRAYEKAIRDGNDENSKALEQELTSRGEATDDNSTEIQEEDSTMSSNPDTEDTAQ